MEESMKKIIFVTVGFVALFIFPQVNALACSCPTVGSAYPTADNGSNSLIAGQVRNAKVVFSGEVVGINKIPKTRLLLVTIEVKEFWKEILPEEVTITTELGGCGYRFQVGGEYLVFANGSDDGLTTGECLANKLLYKAAEELKVLGKGGKPQENKSKSLKNARL